MYSLKCSAAFDSAHFLSGYEGKCANIHGHRWVIEASFAGDKLQPDGDKRGMLVDFGDLKKAVRGLADKFDHVLIYESGTLREKTLEALYEEGFRLIAVPFRPTAECFAKYFYDRLKETRLPIVSVTVFETPDNCAAFSA